MAETAELLTRARAGDADAFCELAEACEGQLFRQAVALCHDTTTAEDLTSETLIEAWKSVGRFNGQCRFSTWLYAILLHRYHKLVRRAHSRPVEHQGRNEASEPGKMLEQVPDAGPTPGGLLAQQELSAELREAIESLPEEHAEVVRLRFYQEASLAEIGAALDLPVGTVKSRLHHALEKLRGMKAIVNLLKEMGDT